MVYCIKNNPINGKNRRFLWPVWRVIWCSEWCSGLWSLFRLPAFHRPRRDKDSHLSRPSFFRDQKDQCAKIRLRSQTGFTLIEIMVVMVIISLAATMIVLSLPSPPPEIRKQAEQLVARLNMVSDTALERGTMTGVEMSFQGYRFAARKLGGWVDNPSIGEPGTIYPWPENVRINLVVDGNTVTLENQFDPTIERSPDLYFTPDGLQPPFTLMLRVQDEQIIIRGTPEGKLHMVDPLGGKR